MYPLARRHYCCFVSIVGTPNYSLVATTAVEYTPGTSRPPHALHLIRVPLSCGPTFLLRSVSRHGTDRVGSRPPVQWRVGVLHVSGVFHQASSSVGGADLSPPGDSHAGWPRSQADGKSGVLSFRVFFFVYGLGETGCCTVVQRMGTQMRSESAT